MTPIFHPVIWVLVNKAAELTGRSQKSLNGLVHAGLLVEGKHWKWSADGRRYFNLQELDNWVAHSKGKASSRGRRENVSKPNPT
ncbi:hypothetical protein E4K72_10480 [Oxalobacteraceae bacterium OM1]|nr:hypothetical protein E4K72_10480 [Oxalobacteraceae bacterium OM1]